MNNDTPMPTPKDKVIRKIWKDMTTPWYTPLGTAGLMAWMLKDSTHGYFKIFLLCFSVFALFNYLLTAYSSQKHE